MLTIHMLIELNYVFLSLLLVIYGAWRYYKHRKKHLLYFTLSFTFLALSAIVQMLSSTIWLYGIQVNIITLRLLKLGGLALFACFTISSIIALKTVLKLLTRKNNENFNGKSPLTGCKKVQGKRGQNKPQQES